MADIHIIRTHDLGLAGARAAAERMEAHLGAKFDLKGSWAGNVLNFQRPGVTGSLRITDKDLQISIALGFLLKAMKGSIEKAVEHELETLFAAAPRPPAKPAGEKPRAKTGPAPRKKGA